MKKLYTEIEWKKYSKKRALDEAKRKANKHRKHKRKLRKQKSGIESLKAPAFFSIINNPEETLLFFNDLMGLNCETFIDLSDVEKITSDSILYLLHELCNRNKQNKITGKSPGNHDCERLLANSGFYNYVNTNTPKKSETDSSILSIKKGSDVQPIIAKEVTHFASGGKRAEGIYTTIIECMANTNNHAYNFKNGQWWLMAERNNKNNKVHFTFLDAGQTIPKTVKSKFREKVKKISATIGFNERIDSVMSPIKQGQKKLMLGLALTAVG